MEQLQEDSDKIEPSQDLNLIEPLIEHESPFSYDIRESELVQPREMHLEEDETLTKVEDCMVHEGDAQAEPKADDEPRIENVFEEKHPNLQNDNEEDPTNMKENKKSSRTNKLAKIDEQSQSSSFLDEDLKHICLVLSIDELFSEEQWRALTLIDVFLTTNWDEQDQKPIQRSKDSFISNWHLALANNQLSGDVKLNGSLLRISNLAHDPSKEPQEQSLQLIENLKTYCLWTQPFIEQEHLIEDDSDIQSKNCLLYSLGYSRFLSSDSKKGGATPLIMLNNELSYLGSLLQKLIVDFKSQINSLINLQDVESKELQRSLVVQKQRGGASDQVMALRSFHRDEMDALKQRQFAIISYMRTTMSGIQQTYDELLNGKYSSYCLDKCSTCQRVLRIATYTLTTPKHRPSKLKKQRQLESMVRKHQEDLQSQLLKIEKTEKQVKEVEMQQMIKPPIIIPYIEQENPAQPFAKNEEQPVGHYYMKKNKPERKKVESTAIEMPNLQKIIDDLSRDKREEPTLIYKRRIIDMENQPQKIAAHRIRKINSQSQNKAMRTKQANTTLNQSTVVIDPLNQTFHDHQAPLKEELLQNSQQQQESKETLKSKPSEKTLNAESEYGKHHYFAKNIEPVMLQNRSTTQRDPTRPHIYESHGKSSEKTPNHSKNYQKPGNSDNEPLSSNFYKYNYYKNDLSFLMEPQKPINLPEINKPGIQANFKANIESNLKNQSLWSQNFKRQQSNAHNTSQDQQQQQFQFNYFSERRPTNNGGMKGSKIPYKDSDQSKPTNNHSSSSTINGETQSRQFTNQQRYSQSRDGYQADPNHINQHIQNTHQSKYTNIKDEKAKVSKILEEFEKKQRLEKELKMQSQLDSEMIFKVGSTAAQVKAKVYDTQTPEQIEYVKELLKIKPWLACLPLKASKLEYLRRTFPLEEFTSAYIQNLTGKDQEDYQAELDFVQSEVVAKRNMLREKKTDYELLMDARYFNKYGDYLIKRLQTKNFYQRLEVSRDASKSDIKKAYYKLALIWHPDNIRKKFKYGFAHEEVFTRLVAEIFVLFEEAYKTLSNDESKGAYDAKL